MENSPPLKMMRRCLTRLHSAASQKGLEASLCSKPFEAGGTKRTITSRQGVVSSELPDVEIPSVQLTPLVVDRAAR